jgi:Kazal-type serine protease inhibitor domain
MFILRELVVGGYSMLMKNAFFCFCLDTPDPCRTKTCQFGARCVTTDGRYANCECPTFCPSSSGRDGDSEDSQAVCGSDGKLYRNRCELDREACRWMRNITVKYHGKCGESFLHDQTFPSHLLNKIETNSIHRSSPFHSIPCSL